MNKIIIVVAFFMLAKLVDGQIQAVTEQGDTALLYENGSWRYLREMRSIENSEIRSNPTEFSKATSSIYLVKSKKIGIGILINPDKWQIETPTDGSTAEFNFQMKGEDLYAMMITERMEVPFENLREIALMNGKAAAPDLKLIDQEFRTVNGLKILMIQMSGTIEGIRFKYYNYYFTSSEGTAQLLTYTSEKMFPLYKSEMEVFLNGLIAVE
jgi:hypothetical protein